MNSAMWYQTAAQTTVPSATLKTHMQVLFYPWKIWMLWLTEASPFYILQAKARMWTGWLLRVPNNPEILVFCLFYVKSAYMFLPVLFPHCSSPPDVPSEPFFQVPQEEVKLLVAEDQDGKCCGWVPPYCPTFSCSVAASWSVPCRLLRADRSLQRGPEDVGQYSKGLKGRDEDRSFHPVFLSFLEYQDGAADSAEDRGPTKPCQKQFRLDGEHG